MTDAARILAAYTAAADTFDALPFWHEFGRRTVERLQLAPGERVLDLCCGTGASALPAAHAVGPTGSVLGVDLTPALVAVAQGRAAAAGLGQARFAVGDIDTLDYPAASFDAVASVFGLFFAADMAAVLRRARTWLAPGGRLAVTVWGETVLAPGEALFWDAVRGEDPTLEHVSPAGRITTPAALSALFVDAGLPAPAVRVERWAMPLDSPEAFWPVIFGTSNRGVWDALAPETQRRVTRSVEDALERGGVRELTSDALVAVVTTAA